MSEPAAPAGGVFHVDEHLVVQTWDAWMEAATGISESAACGRRIDELYPDLESRGMLEPMRRAAQEGIVQVLAPAFHDYLIALPPRQPHSSFDRMRQHIVMTPMPGVGVAIAIDDVTPRMERERRMLERLHDPDESVRLHATLEAAAAGATPTLLAPPLADESWRVRQAAVQGMAELSGEEAVATLIEAVRERHRDPALLNSALSALAKTSSDVVEPLADLLRTGDADVRTYAALALGMLHDRRALPTLLSALGDPDTNVRYHAIEALGRIGDPGAAPALLAIAESRDFFLGFAALDALAIVGDANTARRLLPLLDDEMLGEPALDCIGALLGPAALAAELDDSAVQRLVEELPSASDERAGLTAEIVARRNMAGAEATLASLLDRLPVSDRVATLLAARGHAAAEAVAALLPVDDDSQRRRVAVLLGRIGSAHGMPALVALLADQEPAVVAAAAAALAAVGDPRAFHPLVDLLEHPDSMVRHAVVAAINSIGHPGTREIVLDRLGHASPDVREGALRIAGYLGLPEFLDGVIRLCDDGVPSVRRTAVEHLPTFDDARADANLRRLLTADPDATVRSAAARGLARTDYADAGPVLIAAAADSNLWVRYYAVRSLGQLIGGDRGEIVACLMSRASHDAPPVRIAAVEALGELGNDASRELLRELCDDAEPEVAAAARAAVGRDA